MAGAIPAMRGADVVAALEKWGFKVARVEGSHHIMAHPDGRGTTVPVHNKDVAKGTLRSIMRDTGLTAEQLRNAKKLARRQAKEMTPQEVSEGSAPASGAPRADTRSGPVVRRGLGKPPSRRRGERGSRS